MMTTSNRLHRFLYVLTALLPISVAAQQTEPAEKHHEEVTIIGTFDPSINEAFKINTKPSEELNESEKPVFDYTPLDIIHPTEIVSDPITPIAINPNRRETIYNNTLLAGMGSLLTPYLEFFHSQGQKNQYRFNAHVQHISSFHHIKDYAKSPYSQSGLDLDVAKYMSSHILSASVAYQLNTNRYYGYKPDDFPTYQPSDNQLKQAFNLVEAKVGLASNYKNNKKLHHEVNLGAYYYFDKYKSSETHANLDFNAYKEYELTDLLDYQQLGLSGNVSYYGSADSIKSANSTLITAMPYFKGNYSMFNFTVGLQFNFLNTNSFDFYFYPVLHASAHLIDESLTAFAGIDGQVEYNGYRKLTTENPWLKPDAARGWDRGMRIFAGFRGNVSHQVNYSIQGTWKKFNNLYFFINQQASPSVFTFEPQNKFFTVFDKGSRIGVDAEVTYTIQQNVKAWVGGHLYKYTLDSLDQPYHKPLSEFELGVAFTVMEKITIETELFGSGKRYALDVASFPSTEVELDPYIDLNLSINYQLTDQFAVWLSGTNLLNNQYQRYYSYPVQGWQVMGGITYKF